MEFRWGFDEFINDEDACRASASSGYASEERWQENDRGGDSRYGESDDWDISVEDVMAREFGSIEEAEKWYKQYARLVGFGVRRDRYGRNINHEVIWRSWVCDRAGFRAAKHLENSGMKKRQRPLTRCGCVAYFRVRRDEKTLKWKVDKFEENHIGHEVVGEKFGHLIRSHRSLSKGDIAQAKSMRDCGITTSRIMGFMVRVAGGHDKCGFVQKDLYNHFHSERHSKIPDRDVVAALCYLQAKADMDPMAFVKYTTDSENRLQHLFWCDGQSRVDFQCFGDVLSFDTTYKKNMYNKPLVMFSGLNHHGQNIVFGAAILADETEMTYTWVLRSLTEAMDGKKPVAVVTDGDKAMCKAIKAIFPGAVHRLCSWHLARNACSNVSNVHFQHAFRECMYMNTSVDVFEEKWKEAVERYDLQGNAWIMETYERRKLWATAYLKDKFFAGIRTTSRCESLNGFIASFVKCRDTLVDMLHHFERGLTELRNNEFIEDFKCLSGEPVIDGPLHVLEKQATELFTRKAFSFFHGQAVISGDLTMLHRHELLNHVMYRIGKFLDESTEWEVLYDKDNEFLSCDCHMYQSCGIPCSHILCAMKYEHISRIPESLICKRWTRTAKTQLIPFRNGEEQTEGLNLLRYGSLNASCNWLCHLACEDGRDYDEVRNKVGEMIEALEARRRGRLRGRVSKAGPFISDPVNIRTKGRPSEPKRSGKRQNKCAACKMVGHNRSTCPVVREKRCDVTDNLESDPYHDTEASGPLDGDNAVRDVVNYFLIRTFGMGFHVC